MTSYDAPVPFTFLAHQAPLLPLARRWPARFDGVALIIGSMAPDMAYVLAGSRLDVWAHDFPALVTFCVPVTLVVSWLVVSVLAPVVPDHLPDLGGFHLRDLRGLATHRFGVRSGLSALAGALSHVALDSFTHPWGWFARNIAWYAQPLGDATWLGAPWTPFRLMQYLGHVGASGLCVLLLHRYGRQRWMTERAARVTRARTSLRSHLVLWIVAGAVTAAGLMWVMVDPAGVAPDVLRAAACAFAGLCVGSALVRSRFGGVLAVSSPGSGPASWRDRSTPTRW
ncbi:MAG: DUF4184 family protein [Acidimicrobiales bacterium]